MITILGRVLRRRFAGVPLLRQASLWLHSLLGIQLLLGGAAWWSRIYAADFPQPIPVMITFTVIHTVMGALVLASTVLFTIVCHRVVLRREAEAPVAMRSERA
jgi:hypothetical protein